MGKQQAVQQSTDYYPDITNVVIPERAARALSQSGRDPKKLQDFVNEQINAGGETKAKAINELFPLLDKLQGSNSYSNLLKTSRPATNQQREAAANPQVSVGQDFFGSVYNAAIPTLLEGVAKMGLSAYQTIEGSLSDDAEASDKNWNRRNKAITEFTDSLKTYVDHAAQTSPISWDTEKGEVDFSNIGNARSWAGTMGNLIGIMLPMFVTRGAGGVLGKLGVASNASKLGNTMVAVDMIASTMQMFPQYQKDAMDNGFTIGQATAYAAPLSIVNGAIEFLGANALVKGLGFTKKEATTVVKDILEKNTGKVINELATGKITREGFDESMKQLMKESLNELGDKSKMSAFKSVLRKSGKAFVDQGVPEASEELLQGATEYFAQGIVNNYASSKEGNFDQNIGEAATNAIFGAVLGGLMGTSMGMFHKNPELMQRTSMSYINAEIKNKVSEGKAQSLDQVKQSGNMFRILDQARENGEMTPEEYAKATQKADLMYDVSWQFKDLTDYTPNDRNSMFNIASTRQDQGNQAQILQGNKQRVAEIDQILQGQVQPQPDQDGVMPSREKLETDKARFELALGPYNEEAGAYQNEVNLAEQSARTEKIFSQASRAIVNPDTKNIGNSFLNNALKVIKDPQFVPKTEISMRDGKTAVQDESGRIAELIVQPNIEAVPVVDQMTQGLDYIPYRPETYTIQPMDDIETYKKTTADLVTNKNTSKARDISKNFSYAKDASDVLAATTQFVDANKNNPLMDVDVRDQVQKNYDFYNQIARSPGAHKESVYPMPIQDFQSMVGLEPDVDLAEIQDLEEEVNAQETPLVDIGAKVTVLGTDGNVLHEGATVTDMTDDGLYVLTDLSNKWYPVDNVFSEAKPAEKKKRGRPKKDATKDVAPAAEEPEAISMDESPSDAQPSDRRSRTTEITPEKTEQKPAKSRPKISDVSGQDVYINGRPGKLTESNGRYTVETDRDIFELPSDVTPETDAFDLGITPNRKASKPAKSYNVTSVSEIGATVNSVEYAINTDEKGNIESLSPVNNPEQSLTNERLLTAVEIARNKEVFRELSQPSAEIDNAVNQVLSLDDVGPLIDNIFTRNFTETTEQALNKLENGESLNAAEKLALDLWVTDAIINTDKARVSRPNNEELANMSDYFDLLNRTLYGENTEIQPAPESNIQSSATDGNAVAKTTTEVVRKQNSRTSNRTQETLDDGDILERPGTNEDIEQPQTIESEYTEQRQLAQTFDNIDESIAQLREVTGPIESAEEIDAEATESEDDIRRLVADAESADRAEREYNRRNAEAIGSLLPVGVNEQPGDNNSGSQGTTEAPGSVIEVKPKKKGVPKSQRQVVNKDSLRALKHSPTSVNEHVAQYFIAGGLINTSEVPRFLANSGENSANGDRKALIRITTGYSPTVEQLAHTLWEEGPFTDTSSDTDYRDSIIETLSSFRGVPQLAAKVNFAEDAQNLQPVDPDFVPDETGTQPEIGTEEWLAQAQAIKDEDLPFDKSQVKKPSQADARVVTNRLGLAFPNVTVNIPATQQEYLDVLNSVVGPTTIYDSSNNPLGYVNPIDGSVNYNPETFNPNTAVHEFGHIWGVWAKSVKPELYQRGIDLISQSKYLRDVEQDPNYKGLTRERAQDEALTRAIGDKGQQLVTTAKKTGFRAWVNELFDNLKKYLGISKLSPDQLQDISLDEFTTQVVADLLNGETVSEITSQQVATILGSKMGNNNPNTVPIEDQVLFQQGSANPYGVAGTGETVGTHQDFQNQAIVELGDTYGKPKALFKPADRANIQRVFLTTGWKYEGINDQASLAAGQFVAKWSFNIADNKNMFFTDDERIVYTPSYGAASQQKSRITETVQNGINLLTQYDKDTPFGKIANFAFTNAFTRLGNTETQVAIIDDGKGLMTQLVKNAKRLGSQRKTRAINEMAPKFQMLQRQMAKFSIFKGGSTLDTVVKMPLEGWVFNPNLGRAEKKRVMVPVSVGMSLLRNHQTQQQMSDEYKRTGSAKLGNEEIHTSVVIDDQHFDGNGNLIDPSNTNLFYGKQMVLTTEATTNNPAVEQVETIRKGAMLPGESVFETDAEGNLVQAKNYLGATNRSYNMIFSNAEMDKLADRLENGNGASSIDEVEAYQGLKDYFNNQNVTDMLAKENDEFLNPADTFQRVGDYYPIKGVYDITASARVNSFSPSIEDVRTLHEREKRPNAVFIQDAMSTGQYYMDSVATVMGSGRLVHNMKNIYNTISTEYEGQYKQEIMDNLIRDIDQFQNYQQYKAKNIKDSLYVKAANTILNKYTSVIFRGNFGIALKQFGTYASAIGQGYIDDNYLRKALPELMRLSRGIVTDTLTGAGSTIIEGTDIGTKDATGRDTVEKEALNWLLGTDITDPIEKEMHRRRWAVTINRAIYGQHLYVEGVDYDKVSFTKQGLANVKQVLNKFDSFTEDHGMSPIRRGDRAVILAFVKAAQLQVADELAKPGNTLTKEQLDDKAAKMVEDTLYSTNQMSDITDLAPLQRDTSFIAKIIGLYSGQTQKLFNQMFQNYIEYVKYSNGATEDVRKGLKRKLVSSLVSNLVINSTYIAAVNIGWSLAKTALKGEEPKEDDYYAKKFGFDVIRNIGAAIPGFPEQLASAVISKIDNEAWEQGLFDVPGLGDFAEDVWGTGDNMIKWFMAEDAKKQDKYLDSSIYHGSKVLGVAAGVPKVITDVGSSWLAPKDEKKKKGGEEYQTYDGIDGYENDDDFIEK